jgi:hypothetical protein
MHQTLVHISRAEGGGVASFCPAEVIATKLEINNKQEEAPGTSIANKSQPYIELNCSLGEGPFWEEETNTVRFLDVEKQELHRVDINKGPSSHKLVKKLDISIG